MIWIEIGKRVSKEDIKKYGLAVCGTEILLTNDRNVKAFLYSKFPGSKELILKQEGFEDERLNLNELFNEI